MYNHPPRIGIIEDDSDTEISRASNTGAKKLIEESGGVAVPLKYFDPADENWRASASQDIEHLDGLIVLGNKSDLDPADFNQPLHPKVKLFTNQSDKARAAYEKEIIPAALERKIPMFMVCAGMQRLNVILGGNLHQHIPDLLEDNNRHSSNANRVEQYDRATMPISVLKGTALAKTLDKMKESASKGQEFSPDFNPANQSSIMVNSLHHQAVDKLGEGLRVSAYSNHVNSNGAEVKIVEAIEPDPHGKFRGQYIQGRQWHPELMPESDVSKTMFKGFVTAAAERIKQQGQSSYPKSVQRHR